MGQAALGVALEPDRYAARLTACQHDAPLQPRISEFLRGLRLPICIVSNAD